MKTFIQYFQEMVYPGNMGAIEMIQFFQKADKKQIAEMDRIVKGEDWDAFKKLIKQVLGVKLK